jgi:HK97 family phage portal protein
MAIIPKWLQFNKKEDKAAAVNMNPDKQLTQLLYRFLANNQILYNPESDESFIQYGYKYNSTLYAIINYIIRASTTVPFQVFEIKSKSKANQYASMTKGTATPQSLLNSRLVKSKAFDELEDTDLHELLYRPNPMQGYSAFLSSLIGFGKLTGNRYIQGIAPKTGDNAGKFKEMHVLPSQYMEIVSGGYMQLVKGYRMSYNPTQQIEAKNICHIKDFNPAFDSSGSSLYGQSPLLAAFRALETNNEAIDTEKALMINQASRGLLVPKNSQAHLDQVQMQQLQESLKQKMRDNRGGIAITSAELDWVNFGLSAGDMELLAMMDATDNMLCRVYGVHPNLLNIGGDSTYENQDSAKKSLYQNCVIPELINIRDELNRWLIPTYGENLYLDFDFSSIAELQEDQAKITEQLKSSWWLYPDEMREVQGWDRIGTPEMNKIYIPQGYMPIEDMELGLGNMSAFIPQPPKE